MMLSLILIFINIPVTSFANKKYDLKSGGFFMDADHVQYDSDQDYIIAKGDVRVVMTDYYIRANYLYYDVQKDTLYASGNVYIRDDKGNIIIGDRVLLKDKIKQGIIQEFVIKFDSDNIIASKLARRKNEQNMSLYHSSFTPCDTCGKTPIWQIKSKETDINLDQHRIFYNHVFFQIYGMPLMYLPFFSHPTPSAPAKSGILVPKIENNRLVVPLYYRAKSDTDFTLYPKIIGNNRIIELEARHKKKHGDLKTTISYSRIPNRKPDKYNPSKNRYFIVAKGVFSQNNVNYGAQIKRVSDKAYLKNHYDERYESYLESNFYINAANYRNYFDITGMHFQDLRSKQKNDDIPLIFPSVNTRNVFTLNEDETLQFTIKNNTIFYNNLSGNQLARSAFDLDITHHIISDYGYIMNIKASNRSDIYLLNYQDDSNQMNSQGNNIPRNIEDARYRNIPEIHSKISIPFIKSLSERSSIVIEPITSVIIGKNYDEKYKKFGLVDVSKFELTEHNIFDGNRFSGTDYHEYGQRLNYGLQCSILSDILYQRIFISQALYKHNIPTNNNQSYVGSYNLDLLNGFDAFYRFRKTKNFHAIRDELGANLQLKDLQISSSFTSINNVSRFFADDEIKVPGNKMKQLVLGIEYALTSDIKIGNEIRFNIKGSKFNTLQRSIKVTYEKDCVSISGKFYNDLTSDANRGIKKINAPTIEIGLKTINM